MRAVFRLFRRSVVIYLGLWQGK